MAYNTGRLARNPVRVRSTPSRSGSNGLVRGHGASNTSFSSAPLASKSVRPAPIIDQRQWKFGASPRTVTAQGVRPVSVSANKQLQTQALFVQPSTLGFKSATNHVSATRPLRQASPDKYAKHAGTITGAQRLTPYGGYDQQRQPILLGSRIYGTGRPTARFAVAKPPQPLIPNAARKLFAGRG